MPAHRLALAAPLGATGTIDVRQASLTTAGYEPDVLLECSGMPKALTLRLAHVQNFEIELTGTFRYANTWPTAIALSASGAVDLDRLVTHRFGLADVEQALTVSTRDKTAVKAVVYPQEQRPTWWRRVEAGHMVMEKWPSSSGGPVGTASTFSRLLTTVRAGIEEHRNVHYGSDATHRHVGPPQHRMRTHGTAPRIDPSPGAHARGEQVGADPVTRGEQKVRRLFDHLVRIARSVLGHQLHDRLAGKIHKADRGAAKPDVHTRDPKTAPVDLERNPRPPGFPLGRSLQHFRRRSSRRSTGK